MKDCFVLRFNLENAVNPDTKDRVGALSSLFDIDKVELEESVAYYQEKLSELADSIDDEIIDKAKRAFFNKKIAFFGDSLTSDRLSYANIIKKLGVFGQADIFAVSGTVSGQTIRNFNQIITNNKYDIVCLFIGTNDSALTDIDLPFVSPDEFKRNIEYAAAKINASGAVGILFELPKHSERCLSSGEIISEKYNSAIIDVGKKEKFKVFDLNDIPLEFIDDNVHFTAETQRKIAEHFLKMQK